MQKEYYEEIMNANNEPQLVNVRTGEIIETVRVEVPVGSRIYTPEEQEAYRKHKELEQKKSYRRTANADLGKNFYFVPAEQDFGDISPQTATRLIYLATYAEFETGKLMRTRRKPMKKTDLPQLLNISESSVKSFWREASPEYIHTDDNGFIIVNTEIFQRGYLKRCSKGTEYQKFFCENVQKIYNATDISQHKHLGYVFQMLPHINYEYNVLCRNTDETDVHRIDQLTLDDFCTEIGFDKSNLSRLLHIYRTLTFDVNGQQERFCAFIYDGIDKGESRIVVNPHILYNGTDFRHVEILATFCV